MISEKRAIVVGSGVAGLVSAYFLKKKFDHVTLIERNSHLGGLLYSHKSISGFEFDYGTHFMRETGIKELDDMLYDHLDPKKWLSFGNLKTGNYFHKVLDEKSPFVNTHLLPKKIYQQGMIELLELKEPENSQHKNLEDFLIATFGPTFTEHVYRPVALKFFGHDLKELAPTALNLMIHMGRLIGLTPEITRQLKKIPSLNRRLGFHSSQEGQSAEQKFYPIKGGIGLWVDEIEKKLINQGIRILKNANITKIHHQTNKVEALMLKDGSTHECDQLVWTAPAYQCLFLADLKPPFNVTPPTRLITGLYHFVFDEPFVTSLYYVVCMDIDLIPFRVTCYSNIQGNETEKPHYRATVEVLSLEELNVEETFKKILSDLVTMGIISKTTRSTFQEYEPLPETLPVFTPHFVESSQKQLDFLKKSFSNVLFSGKNIGDVWFMRDVLRKTYELIKM